ncbi:MAG: anti-sigma F factor [Candidatus Enterenecus sp.]
MKAIDQVTITFTSRSANEGFARSAAACFAAQLDPTLDELADIKTAVSEAVTNAIVHAYPDRLGTIVMRLRLLEGGVLEVRVRDTGVGIPDVEQARAPLFTTGSEERSGMGFTIMESFMDSLNVRSAPGKGTTVTMRKRIARRAGVPR